MKIYLSTGDIASLKQTRTTLNNLAKGDVPKDTASAYRAQARTITGLLAKHTERTKKTWGKKKTT